MQRFTTSQILALLALIFYILAFIVSGYPIALVAGVLLSVAVLMK